MCLARVFPSDWEPEMDVLTDPHRRSLLDHFSAVPDPRQAWRVAHPLPEVLLLVVCGTIAANDDYSGRVRHHRRQRRLFWSCAAPSPPTTTMTTSSTGARPISRSCAASARSTLGFPAPTGCARWRAASPPTCFRPAS